MKSLVSGREYLRRIISSASDLQECSDAVLDSIAEDLSQASDALEFAALALED